MGLRGKKTLGISGKPPEKSTSTFKQSMKRSYGSNTKCVYM